MVSYEPSVRDYMSKSPRFIDADSPLSDALAVMRESKSKYLPVVAGTRVVGILKDDAVRLAKSLLGSEEFTASDWMSSAPTVVLPNVSLYEVLDETPDNVYGCTVVQNGKGEIEGIFTPREAFLAMQDLAQESRRMKQIVC